MGPTAMMMCRSCSVSRHEDLSRPAQVSHLSTDRMFNVSHNSVKLLIGVSGGSRNPGCHCSCFPKRFDHLQEGSAQIAKV